MKKYFFGYFLTSLFNVLSLKLYANILSLDQFGEFSYLQSFFIIISTFFSKFVGQALYKYYTEYSLDDARFSAFARVIKEYIVAYIILIVLIFCFLSNYIGYGFLDSKLISVIFITVFLFFVDIQNAYLQTSNQPSAFIRNEILRCILKLILPYLFMRYISHTIGSFLLGFAVAHFITPLIQVIKSAISSNSKDYKVAIDTDESRRIRAMILKYSYAISIWYLMIQLVNYVDRIFLFDKYGSEIIGKYSANFSVFSFASQIIAMPLISALHPKLLKLTTDTDEMKSSLQSLLNVYSNNYIKIQFIIVGFLVFWYKEITTILLNAHFILSFWEIFALVVGYSFWNLGSYGNKIFETSSNTGSMISTLLISIAIYIPLLYILGHFIQEHSIFLSKAIMYFSYPLIQMGCNRIYLRKGVRQVQWNPKIFKALFIASLWFLGFWVYSHLPFLDVPNIIVAIFYKVVFFLTWLFLILLALIDKSDWQFILNFKERANDLFK